MNYRIFPLGDSALTVEFGNEISVELNDRALLLAQIFALKNFEGFIETVPAYSSLSIFYDVVKVRKNYPEFQTAYEKVKDFTESLIKDLKKNTLKPAHCRIEIPVCFEADFSPDLEFVGSLQNLSIQEVIQIFLSRTYRVFMLGFLPGFSYMGEVDERIAAPRKQTPRLDVQSGSVGIAGKQTGIYSLESPGGWQIIGRTPIKLFTPDAAKPALLSAGDSVEFYEISRQDYFNIKDQTQ